MKYRFLLFSCHLFIHNLYLPESGYGQSQIFIFRDTAFNNYNFNKSCIKFIKKIQPFFAKVSLQEQELPWYDDGNGVADVDTAKIVIRHNAIDKEELIIHELFHLYLKTLGFPTIKFSFPHENNATKNNIDFLNWFIHMYWDKIEHFYFYPIMYKQLHLNPYRSIESQLKEIFKGKEITGLKEASKEITLSGYYLQVYIETNNRKTLLKFKQFLIDNYGGLGINYGEELVSLFEKTKIKTSNDAINLFINCFNTVNKNVKIDLPAIEKVKHKNYTRQFATFPISAVSK